MKSYYKLAESGISSYFDCNCFVCCDDNRCWAGSRQFKCNAQTAGNCYQRKQLCFFCAVDRGKSTGFGA